MKTSVILHGLHNEFTLDQMKACIELAEKYGGSFRHVVTGIQITGIEKDDKEQFISELPDGYDQAVTERGSTLSSGQRQLIAFARTVAAKPKILILDEATANIDSETEEVIQHSLKKMRKGRTTIAIAHRLSTIQDADCIYVLDKGRIIESGTHDQLLALEGTYQKMYQLQAGQLQQS